MQVNEQSYRHNQGKKALPFFFREDYAGFIVKGRFETLSVKPQLVEEGEWIAHQMVEQSRLLASMVKIVQTEDRSSGRAICNEQSCPTMAAGSVTYTWVDTNRNPINLPAATYIKHILTWVAGKTQDEDLLPTSTFQTAPPAPTPEQVANDPTYHLGKPSGFPQRFEAEVKNVFRQMFRCYAHLYWQHWLNFWDLSAHRDLNTCFIHFVNVGRMFGLLSERDTEPMQPLIDLWTRKGDLPKFYAEGAPAGSDRAPLSAGGASSVAPGAAS